jgi:hypothetical protein
MPDDKIIILKVNGALFQAFEAINRTGLYGNTLEDTVERLACSKIEMLWSQGCVYPPRKDDQKAVGFRTSLPAKQGVESWATKSPK